MHFSILALYLALAAAATIPQELPRDSVDLHHLVARQSCGYPSICPGGCGTCYQNTNVCCPRDSNKSCFQFSC
ncbi:hypothetical protein BDP81DRAFT_440293 [Colletotrichum phormii]|uniref:Uncharacterized protein n=1 Tax=Colletotrichum phormii TaxID=359342 RepID=A0AAJ0E9T1_9PEZI|nr:uncharacterized protein BDP81DRAFT_440293 [Colletotrichum phormii]KAK1623160.1 hypothetical protein BDP81DRAFT_440293 [Colletotrichum phormii]